MRCRDVVECTTEIDEGVLTPRRRLEYFAHLLMCPYCRAHKRQVDTTVATLRRLPKEGPSEQARERALATFRDRKRDV